MTIKELAALLTVFAGIVANLMFQDSLALHTGADDWRVPQRATPQASSLPLPTLLALHWDRTQSGDAEPSAMTPGDRTDAGAHAAVAEPDHAALGMD